MGGPPVITGSTSDALGVAMPAVHVVGDAPAPPRRSWPWAVGGLIGLVLVVVPLAGGMLYPAAQGQAMVTAFAPYVTEQRMDTFRADLDRLSAAHAAIVRIDSSGRVDATRYPQIDDFVARYPAIDADMRGLIDRIDAGRTDFERLADLRPIDVIPFLPIGAGLLILGGSVWAWRRARTGRPPLPAALVVGVVAVALVVTPLVRGMPGDTRAATPLLDRYSTVLTAAKVRDVQGYFVVLVGAVGAVGAVDSVYRAEIATAPRQDVAAVDDLRASWQRMSSDFAGLIGTMNDNLGNYHGVRALNDRTAALGVGAFAVLPWFLVAAGALTGIAAALGITSDRRRERQGKR
ncbi:hypothetical protein LX12_002458 [Williamsia serinedens]|uniref:Uncharacterized protein n=1 Tax=Williamsia serinedens TaxID=391736 RepID=A0ABT1H215_9NOCA|nr:hypothetical protein [Williamsia serinedens]